MSQLFLHLLHLALLVAASPLLATVSVIQPRVTGATLYSSSFTGAGCPSGTVAAALALDASSITVLFNAFKVYTGPGLPSSVASRGCQYTLLLTFPRPYQVAVSGATYQLDVNLAAGTTSTTTSTHWFLTQPNFYTVTSSTLPGPYDGFPALTETIPSNVQIFSPCGANQAVLMVQTSHRLTTTNPSAYGESFVLSHKVNLGWKTC